MKAGLIKAFSVTLLAGGGLLTATPALGAVTRPHVESISGAFTSGDRIHAQLRVGAPAAGSITLELEGYSPSDRRFHTCRVGARVFTISAYKSTYNGYFQDVSDGLAGTHFTKFRLAIKSWTVDYLGGTSTVSNAFTRPASTPSPEPSPSSDLEDDSVAAPTRPSSPTDWTGLISAGDGTVDTTGGSDGSSVAVDSFNPSPPALPQSHTGQRAVAPAAVPRAVKQPASAKLLASAGWTASGGWMLLFLVPVVAGCAMFAVLARAER
jgi:hypothetical protein